jgi:hypothetical protein
MPEKGSRIKFQNHNHSIRVPFVVYVDFEAYPEPTCIKSCEPASSEGVIYGNY